MSMVLNTRRSSFRSQQSLWFHICFIMALYYRHYYRMRQTLLQNATAILLQNATKVYYKMRQLFDYKMRQFYYKKRQLMRPLLQNASVRLVKLLPQVSSYIFINSFILTFSTMSVMVNM